MVLRTRRTLNFAVLLPSGVTGVAHANTTYVTYQACRFAIRSERVHLCGGVSGTRALSTALQQAV